MQNISTRYLLLAACAAGAGALVWLLLPGTPAVQKEIGEGETIASTTEQVKGSEGVASTEGGKPLPPEPVFVMPPGATMIDEYAFSQDGGVYFRSLVDATTHLPVKSADPQTFKRALDFMTYPGSDVVEKCGTSPRYTFYTDKYRPYFYQMWRAPEYRASRVDAMNGADAANFRMLSPTSATDGKIRFDIAYKLGTSTCRLILNQAVL